MLRVHTPGVPYFALFYDVVDDYVERRKPLREAHLGMLRELEERGELLLGGAIGEPISGALIVFKTEGREAVEAFARRDPYVTNGLVTRWEIKPWHVVIGSAR